MALCMSNNGSMTDIEVTHNTSKHAVNTCLAALVAKLCEHHKHMHAYINHTSVGACKCGHLWSTYDCNFRSTASVPLGSFGFDSCVLLKQPLVAAQRHSWELLPLYLPWLVNIHPYFWTLSIQAFWMLSIQAFRLQLTAAVMMGLPPNKIDLRHCQVLRLQSM